MSKQSWNKPAPANPGQGAKGAAVMEPPAPEGEAAVIKRQLEDRGWCLLRFGEAFGGDTIVVTANKLITGYPDGYPVYSTGELTGVLSLDEKMQMALHRAKRVWTRAEAPENTPKEGDDGQATPE